MENENEMLGIFNSTNDLTLDYGGFGDEISNEDEITDPNDNPIDENINNEPVEEDNPENVDEVEDGDESEGDEPSNNSPSLYSSFATVLKEQGVIPSLESSDNIKTIDDLATSIKKEIELQAQVLREDFINNIDVEKIAVSKKQQLELASIDETYLKDNLSLAKDLILQDYLNQGLPEDRAKKLLKKTIDLGEDVVLEDALESLESLKVFQQKQIEAEKLNYQKQVKAQQEEQLRLDSELKNKIYNSKEIVKGLPVTKAIQERVYNSMTEIVGKNPETGQLENRFMQDRSKDPIAFDINMYYLYTITNGFTDFKNILNTATSKSVIELEKQLRKNKFEDNGTPDYLLDKDSYGGIGSELVY